MSQSFQVFIRNLHNHSITINVSPTNYIHELKEHIKALEGIPSDLQRLIFNGKELNNNKNLHEIQIQRGDSLELRLALKGGGNERSCCKFGEKFEYSAHSSPAVSLAISNDSKHIVSGGLDGKVTVFDTENKSVRSQRIYRGELASLAVTTDKRYIVSSCYFMRKSLKILDFNSLVCIREFSDAYVTCVEVTKDGRHVICGTSDGIIKIYSLSRLNCVYTFKNVLTDPITSIIVRDNFIICGTTDIKILSLAQRKCVRIFQEEGKKTRKIVAVSQNSKYLVQCGEDRCIKIYSFRSGRCLQKIPKADKHLIESMEISKNNRILVVLNCKSVIKFFSISTGRCISFFAKEKTLRPDFPLLKITPDSQNLVLTNDKGSIKVISLIAE